MHLTPRSCATNQRQGQFEFNQSEAKTPQGNQDQGMAAENNCSTPFQLVKGVTERERMTYLQPFGSNFTSPGPVSSA
jgi:hypothetical protein